MVSQPYGSYLLNLRTLRSLCTRRGVPLLVVTVEVPQLQFLDKVVGGPMVVDGRLRCLW